MYTRFLYIIITLLAITTLCINFLKPQMHKPVLIYNSDYKIVENVSDIEEEKNIPTQTNVVTTKPITQKIENKVTPTKSVKKVVSQKTVVEPKKQVTQKTTQSQKITPPQVNITKVAKNIEEKKEVTQQKLTEQQEIIMWNKWRSNIQNQIMHDVKLPIIQEGVIFKFSFEVDKFGRIYNVKTWSLSPNYTPYAIQYIAPVIKSYQGRAILEFPQGSNRFSTLVEGSWKIAKSAKFSTPEDYNDLEKVNK